MTAPCHSEAGLPAEESTFWSASCILCFAGPLAKGCRRAQPDEIPEEEGLLLTGNGLEIIQNLLSQEFNQRQMPVSDKEMSIHFKQRLL